MESDSESSDRYSDTEDEINYAPPIHYFKFYKTLLLMGFYEDNSNVFCPNEAFVEFCAIGDIVYAKELRELTHIDERDYDAAFHENGHLENGHLEVVKWFYTLTRTSMDCVEHQAYWCSRYKEGRTHF